MRQRAGGEALVVEALSRQPEVEQGAGLAAARVRQQPSGASVILCRSVRVKISGVKTRAFLYAW